MTFEIGSFKEAQLEVSSAGRLFQMAGTVCQQECSVEAVATMIGCFANASACVSFGFRLRNARNASGCV